MSRNEFNMEDPTAQSRKSTAMMDDASSNAEGLSLEVKHDGVAVLWIDVPGKPVNTLHAAFSEQLVAICDRVERDIDIRALVIASKKRDNFVAGADLDMLARATTAAEGEALSQEAQRAFNRLEALTKPVVAAIHGTCLGGGLELALACHVRLVTDARSTKLGLPEVQLGLLPGAGGTQRLPKVVGVQVALDMMLTGKQIDGRKAKRLGLARDVVPYAILLHVAEEMALRLADKPLSKPSHGVRELSKRIGAKQFTEWALTDNAVGRRLLFSEARKQLRKKTRGNYPAPERILDVVSAGLDGGTKQGLAAEAKHFGDLLMSSESKALVSVFRGQTALRKDPGVEGSVTPWVVRKVGVLGAGLMGSGIASVTVQRANLPVRLRDKDHEGVLRGLSAVQQDLDKRVQRKSLSRPEAEAVMGRLTGTTDTAGLSECDIIIEAVFEDLALKQRVVREIEALQTPSTPQIFASNTSSLPIAAIAEASAHPERVVGMHYFSPVQKMPLLEVITTDKTDPAVTATCVALGKAQGKTVIVVHDGVGFYTTRILAPFLNEALHLLLEGRAVEDIDRALVDAGFPVGPLKLTDEVGIDVGQKVCKVMEEGFGDRMRAPDGLAKLIENGRLGRKNRKGFYLYGEGKRDVDATVYQDLGIKPGKRKGQGGVAAKQDAQERCMLAMVNEAVLCFQEGILRSARDGDIGAVFGLGFPPFLGGPFHYVDQRGAKHVCDRLRHHEQHHGARFKPAALLETMALRGQSFFGEAAVSPGSVGTSSS